MIIMSANISSKKPSAHEKPNRRPRARTPPHYPKKKSSVAPFRQNFFLQAKLQEPSLGAPGNPASNGPAPYQSSLALIRKMVMLASFRSSHSKPWQSAWCMTKQLITRPPAAQVLTTHLSTTQMRKGNSTPAQTHTHTQYPQSALATWFVLQFACQG